MLCLDDPEVIAALAERRDGDPADGDRVHSLSLLHPAYVIYTSGSTGKPKGVIIQHGGLSASTAARIGHYGSPESIILLPSIAFDSSVATIFWALCAGAKLVVPGADRGGDPRHIGALVAQHAIRSWLSVPTLFSLALDEVSEQLASLHTVVLAGESFSPVLTKKSRRLLAECTSIYNEYGPTEATVWASVARIRSDLNENDTISIGRPIWNTQVFVLDAMLQPVPVGVPGELYISGAGLARGYLNRPDLTGERFVANLFGAPGSRMYRTGDRVRWLPDGSLDFLGRADDQIKIRGFRIELGEIEASLLRHPAVAGATVIAREDRSGKIQLIGYVVPGDSTPDPVALRRALAEQMPDYMVPAAIVVLEALPLTPNGKLDRKALPAPDFIPSITRAPRTPTEEILTRLFSEILSLERVGIDDNFFDLGGDSIGSIQVVARARKAGLALKPKDIFQYQCVAALAAVAQPVAGAHRITDIAQGAIPITPIIREFLARDGLYRCFTQATLLQTPAGLRAHDLVGALQTLIDHHDVLRMRVIRPVGHGEWQLSIPPSGALRAGSCLQQVDISELEGEPLCFRIGAESSAAEARLDPEAGILFQAVWFNAGDQKRGRLLLSIHHLAVDGVSWRILVPDLINACLAMQSGRCPTSDTSGTSFRHWAQSLVAEALSTARAAELPIWTNILGAPDPLLSQRRLDPARDIGRTC